MKKGITAVVASTLLAAGTFCGAAVAQSSGASPPPGATAPAPAPKMNISDAKLKQFIDASREISGIVNDTNKSLATEQDPAKQQQMQQDAEAKMTQAVQRRGFSVDEFKNVSQALQSDMNLRQRAQKLASAK